MGQQPAFALIFGFGVHAFAVNPQKTVKEHHFARGHKLLLAARYVHADRGLLQLGVGHLAGQGAFANQRIEALLLRCAFNLLAAHIRGADGLVGLLCPLGVRVVVATLVVVGSHLLRNHRAASVEAEVGEIHRVRTHIGDKTCFVERLCHAHGHSHGEAQLAGGFLLERGGGEGWGGCALGGTLNHTFYDEIGLFARFEEVLGLLFCGKGAVERGLDLDRIFTCAGGQFKEGRHLIGRFAHKLFNLALALHDEANGHTLHTACRETGTHAAPEYRREFETDQAVEHAACLLRINEVEVDMARMLNGGEDSGLRDFVENDALCLRGVQFEHFGEVPRDGFSLAVLIGSQPDGFGLLGSGAQFADHVHLVGRYLIFGAEGIQIHPEILLFQVANVSETRHDFEVAAEKFLDSLGFGRRLHDD